MENLINKNGELVFESTSDLQQANKKN